MTTYNPKRGWYEKVTAFLESAVAGKEAVDRANKGHDETERAIGRRDIASRKQTWVAVFSLFGSIAAIIFIIEKILPFLKSLFS